MSIEPSQRKTGYLYQANAVDLTHRGGFVFPTVESWHRTLLGALAAKARASREAGYEGGNRGTVYRLFGDQSEAVR